MQFIYKHRNKIMVAIMILMLLPFVFNIGLEPDEPFSMGIIRHNYGYIASLTAMDVHPPLYYWVLKAFLAITTFWTKNIFVKIIFARLLSLIFSLMSLYYLTKILQILKLHFSNYVVAFMFFMCPVVYGTDGIVSTIRMYSLGTMLCFISIYYLLLFQNKNKIVYLFTIGITAALTLYTQYLIGMIIGIYILIVLIKFLLSKKYKLLLQLLITSIFSLVLYIPWIPKILMQFTKQSVNSHTGITSFYNIKYIVMYYGVITILGIILVFNKKLKIDSEVKCILLTNIILYLLILFINLNFNPYSISVRYTSIALIINYVIVGNVLISNLNRNFVKMLLIIFFIPLIYINLKVNIPVQVNTQLSPSMEFYDEFNNMKNNGNNTVKLKEYHLNFQNNINTVSYSIYLGSINKNVQYPTPMSVYVVGNGNEQLFKAVFPNIKNYSTKR